MTHEPEEDADLAERYRNAGDTESAAPAASTRAAILAEGRRVAAQRASASSSPPFDTQRPAANQPRWKLAAFGSAAAVVLAAVLVLPRFWQEHPQVAAISASPPAEFPSEPPVLSTDAAPALAKREAAAPAAAPAATPPVAPPVAAQAPAPAMQSKPAAAAGKTARPEEQRLLADTAAARRQSDALSEVTVTQGQTQSARMAPAAPAANYAPAPAASAGLAALARGDDRDSSVQSAVSSGDTLRLKQLLEQGADSRQPDASGRTPLLLAVIANRPDLVRLLLDHGADPNAADTSGETPLQRARSDAHADIVTLLLNAGAH